MHGGLRVAVNTQHEPSPHNFRCAAQHWSLDRIRAKIGLMRSRRICTLLAAVLLHAAAACFAAEVSIPTSADPAQIPATTYKPEGPGPFPAIVILHDCSGLSARSSGAPKRWSDELVAKGYVTILPDSFTPRGHAGGICTVPPAERNAGVTPTHRASDAYAALAYLRTLPYVDGNRVGLMGGSHGGASTLATMVAPQAKDKGFLAAVALYPACALNMGGWHVDLTGDYAPAAPVQILIGELDDWTPAENCRRLADAAQKAGHPDRWPQRSGSRFAGPGWPATPAGWRGRSRFGQAGEPLRGPDPGPS